MKPRYIIQAILITLSILVYTFGFMNYSVPPNIDPAASRDIQVYFKFIENNNYYILDVNNDLYGVDENKYREAQAGKPIRLIICRAVKKT